VQKDLVEECERIDGSVNSVCDCVHQKFSQTSVRYSIKALEIRELETSLFGQEPGANLDFRMLTIGIGCYHECRWF
jgi:hypothetical protein